jgi:hypothetical protein
MKRSGKIIDVPPKQPKIITVKPVDDYPRMPSYEVINDEEEIQRPFGKN